MSLPVYEWRNKPDHLLSKTQLRLRGRKPGANAVAQVHDRKRNIWVKLYDLSESVPVRRITDAQHAQLASARQSARAARTCTGCGLVVEQKSNLHLDAGRRLCKRCNARDCAIVWARAVLAAPDLRIIDTETTGLGVNDEVIALAIIDAAGDTRYQSLFKPTAPIAPEATAVHGLDAAGLAHAPAWADQWWIIQPYLSDALLLGYNSRFDHRLIAQTCDRYGLAGAPARSWSCAMEQYAAFAGVWHPHYDNWRYHSLTTALLNSGGRIEAAHTALGDARATLFVLESMAAAHHSGDEAAQ